MSGFDLDDEVAHERRIEAGEELAIEAAISRGDAYECEGCGQILGRDEPCPDCEPRR